MSAARWVLHNEGSLNAQKVCNSYYEACRLRMNQSFQKYLPWMSNANFSSHFAAYSSGIYHCIPTSILDFDENYLTSYNKICDYFGIFKDDSELISYQINTKIEKNSPSLAQIYKQSLLLTRNWEDWMQKIFDIVIVSILPLGYPNLEGFPANDFSHPLMIGALFVGFPKSSPFPDISIAISFAHELGHQVLHIYEQSGLVSLDNSKPVYSAIRKTERPAIAALHAAVALAYMIESAKALIQNETKLDRLAYLRALMEDYRKNLAIGLESLRKVKMTTFSELIVSDLFFSL